MTKKSVSAKLEVLKWSRTHSKSPVFGLAVLYPTEVKLDSFGTSNTGKENRYRRKNAILISTLGRFYRANKEKKSVIYTLKFNVEGDISFTTICRLLLQFGIDPFQYPVRWPGLWRQVRISDPSKLYPSLHFIWHVHPKLLSQSPTRKPFNGGNNVRHRKTVEKNWNHHM